MKLISKRRLCFSLATYLGMFAIFGASYCLWRFVFHADTLIGEVHKLFAYFRLPPSVWNFSTILGTAIGVIVGFIINFGLFYFIVGGVFEKENKVCEK